MQRQTGVLRRILAGAFAILSALWFELTEEECDDGEVDA